MKLTLHIEQDNDPINPRKDFEHFSTMICFHKRYDLGDDHDLVESQFSGWEDLEKYLQKENDIHTILPLYLFDHSGITMSTGREGYPFNCPWDAGQVGFIFCTREQVKEMVIKDSLVEQGLRSEVTEYDQYLTGDVYGVMVKNEEGEILDSCWGFFGREYAEKEGEFMLAYIQKEENKRAAEEDEKERAAALSDYLEAVLKDSPYDPDVIARCNVLGSV